MSSPSNFTFRRAAKDDIKHVRQMIQELADFEKMSDGPQLTEEDLIRDHGLNGDREFCHIYILDHRANESAQPVAAGYAICFPSYSTWQGKTYFLEDIYVRPQYRGLGGGAHIFRGVAAKAKEFNCKRVDFHVLAWNPAREFYKKMGAVDLTEAEDWHFYRLMEDQIDQLAR